MKWFHALVLAAAAVTAAACADNALVGSTNAAVEKKSDCTPECANGKVCNPDSGKCVACVTQADCGADAGMQCDHDFECVQCLKSADCSEHLVCIDGACSSCSNDAQCGDKAKCDDGECKSDVSSGDNESESDHSGGSSGKD